MSLSFPELPSTPLQVLPQTLLTKAMLLEERAHQVRRMAGNSLPKAHRRAPTTVVYNGRTYTRRWLNRYASPELRYQCAVQLVRDTLRPLYREETLLDAAVKRMVG